MIFLRSTLFNLFYVIWPLLLTLVCLPVLLFSERAVIRVGRIWAYVIKWGLRILCGITSDIRGQEHIPEGPIIFAVKHQSAWETILFYLLAKWPAFVLKKELAYIPLFGWYVIRAKSIRVDRSAGASALKALVRQSCTRLKEGRQIVLFPEGTRLKPGDKRKYNPGIAALYKEANVPVVPVVLNSGICWPKNSFIKKPGTITLEFLPAIQPGMDRHTFMHRLEDQMETAQDALLKKAK